MKLKLSDGIHMYIMLMQPLHLLWVTGGAKSNQIRANRFTMAIYEWNIYLIIVDAGLNK